MENLSTGKKDVVIINSDQNYVNHLKSLAVNIRLEGKWDGDIACVLSNVKDSDCNDLENRGFKILRADVKNEQYIKYNIFKPYFKRWDYAMYFDCDMMVFDDIRKLYDIHKAADPLKKYIFAETDGRSIGSYFFALWQYMGKLDKIKAVFLLWKLHSKYGFLDKLGFNCGFLIFNTDIITENTFSELLALSGKYQTLNHHTSVEGGDQPTLNLYFYNRLRCIIDKSESYWANMDERTIAAHFWRWFAPWVNENYCNSLKKRFIDKYDENLRLFNDVFKVV